MNRTWVGRWTIGALIWCLPMTASAAQMRFQTVALTAEQAHGLDAGVTYADFYYASISDNGDVGYGALLAGPGVTLPTREAAWAGNPSAPTFLARTGQSTGEAGVTFETLNIQPTLNGSGQFTLRASLNVPSGGATGIYGGSFGTPQYVARTGVDAPEAGSDVKHAYFPRNASINDSGTVAFSSTLTGPGVSGGINDWGIWTGRPGALNLAVRGGMTAPATAGLTHTVLELAAPINNAGQFAFLSRLGGPGTSSSNDRAIFLNGPAGASTLVARTGSAAHGMGAGVDYRWLLPPQLGGGGHVSFVGQIIGAGVTDLSDGGIWTGQPGSVALLARENAQAPGAANGVAFDDFRLYLVEPRINASGTVAMRAYLKGSGVTDANKTGIWAGTPGDLDLVARAQNFIPGSTSVRFSGFFDPAINDLGQVVFFANLSGTGVNSTNGQSLWMTTPQGALELVVRSGSMIEVDEGDFRTISEINVPVGISGEYGFPEFVNNAGDIALGLSFTDGSSGIFVARVPEPAAGASMLTLAVAAALPRRGRR